jgi:hypothetical protein
MEVVLRYSIVEQEGLIPFRAKVITLAHNALPSKCSIIASQGSEEANPDENCERAKDPQKRYEASPDHHSGFLAQEKTHQKHE